jgi:5-methylcytosine-specific restriction protein A
MTAKPARTSMSKARRLRIWEKEKGVCYLCRCKVLAGEAWEAEHVIPWTIGFDDSDDNLKVAHKEGCHATKTKADVKAIAKCKRIERKSDPLTRKPSRMQSRGFQTGGPKQKIASRPWPRKGERT